MFGKSLSLLTALFAYLVISAPLYSDEGMWTLDNLPLDKLKSDYNFVPTQEWLEKVRLSSVRFMNGGSGSLVSPNGLVMTNHHVGLDQIEKLSSAERDLVNNGFYASSLNDELKCPDLEVNILISYEEVTSRVKGQIKPNMTPSEALDARIKEIEKIKKEYKDKTGNRCDVVTLYNGGEYWLYEYKKYQDVRLVFAPEKQIAYFGGDLDNFTYPRYNLDVSFFRIYEDDKPLKNKHFFKWNNEPVKEGELVFMSGNPGTTERLKTYSELIYKRDISLGLHLETIKAQMSALRKYSELGEEQKRRAQGRLFGLGNGLKVIETQLEGLRNPEIIALKKKREDEFKAALARNPELKDKYLSAFDEIEQANTKSYEKNKKFTFRNISSSLFYYAMAIVRYVKEKEKPEPERLPGYSNIDLERMLFRLKSPAPIYKDMDKFLAMEMLELNISNIGADDEYFKLLADGADIRKYIANAIEASNLDNPEYKSDILSMSFADLQKSDDQLIKAAIRIDDYMRKYEKENREEFTGVIVSAREKIADARFAVFGKSAYPDATFTFRITYGAVKGYQMNGTLAPYKTTLYGLFDRAYSFDNQGDYELPKNFAEKKNSLDMQTPVNFVSTCDITGGNSGSPVINRNAEIVGIVFDGNIESIVGNFVYDISKNRAVSVSSPFITESMKKVYKAEKILEEILKN